jgi:hypothetical protein
MSARVAEEPVEAFNEASPGLEVGAICRLKYLGAVRVQGEFGPRIKHRFEAADIAEEQTNFWCDPKMTKGSAQRLMVEAILGRDVRDGERITPRQLAGKLVDAEMGESKKGYAEPIKFFRIRQQGQRPLPTEPTDAPAGESTDPDEWDAPAS